MSQDEDPNQVASKRINVVVDFVRMRTVCASLYPPARMSLLDVLLARFNLPQLL